jgi:high-affinity nickel-transport protein
VLFDDQVKRVTAKTVCIYVLLIAANAAAWLWAWIAFAQRPALLGTAFLAYIFGLRHAFDADHIAAIDNVVRKLMQEGKAPYTTGLFFSLGHVGLSLVPDCDRRRQSADPERDLVSLHTRPGWPLDR